MPTLAVSMLGTAVAPSEEESLAYVLGPPPCLRSEAAMWALS